MRNKLGLCLAGAFLLAAVLGCSRLGQLGGKVNLFEGDTAAKAAAAIKDKVGGPTNVIRVEMRTDEMKVTIQSPKNAKDIDEYTYKNGSVSGPEPVQVMQIGDLAMTGDKYGTTPIDEIGWANIPATVQRAIEVSKLENAKVNTLSMDAEVVTQGSPELKEQLDKETDAKRDACMKSSNMGPCLQRLMIGQGRPLVLTWRLFVESPRGRKDFWADKDGKLNEKAF
ncbi:MAG TPA: hypothetical protein VGO43_15230 [Pyrinomonadaceae bacterium]|nr:hypothetical protein [Pyrinomonadaceae bacterium]